MSHLKLKEQKQRYPDEAPSVPLWTDPVRLARTTLEQLTVAPKNRKRWVRVLRAAVV
jgi:hypothetical protein